MADNPSIVLEFREGCPDCAERRADLPAALPDVGDDFDWLVRDYDGFRLFMMEELAARFPERIRWTPADVEVALVEAFAAVLDRLSDTLDRVSAEAFLETARQPSSVRRLLKMIGYDALDIAQRLSAPPFDKAPPAGDPRTAEQRFDQYWLDNPHVMAQAKLAGPRAIHTQKRMVTVADHGERLEDHPVVKRASAWLDWTGSWHTIRVAVILWQGYALDATGIDYGDIRDTVDRYHAEKGLPAVPWTELVATSPTPRTLLRRVVEQYRMAGREVLLEDAVPVGISMSLSVQVDADYYQSEVRYAIEQALGTQAGGFFEPGRLQFGEDLFASDIFETLMALDGVDNVCLNRFKRVGNQFLDRSDVGRIELRGLEIAVCDNRPAAPARGYYILYLHGGRRG